MAAWLDTAAVSSVLGSEITTEVDTDSLDEICAGVADWIEGQRDDLFVLVSDVLTFTVTPSVKVGAALLAWRFYQRRRAIGSDPSQSFADLSESDADIAGLLGIGSHARFVFGAPAAPIVVIEVI